MEKMLEKNVEREESKQEALERLGDAVAKMSAEDVQRLAMLAQGMQIARQMSA